MEKFKAELAEMNLEQVMERKAALEKEIRDAKGKDSLEGMEDKISAIEERIAELKDLEKRKADALALQNHEVTADNVVESRKGVNGMSDIEKRAKTFAETGKTETRAVLATGTIVKPTKASNEINGLAPLATDIVDDVNAVPLTGTGAWIVAYEDSHAEAADVTDGSAVGGTGAVHKYVTINPSEWGVHDEISNQVKKMSPVNYLNAVEGAALDALRAKASAKIVAAVKASELKQEKYSVALDADYLKNVILGFRANKRKGAVCLYITQADLGKLGKVRGTQDKKAVFEISFDAETTLAGTIKEGGMATRFRVLDSLKDGEQLFGQPGAIDMPMWDNYEISTNDGGEYFKKNQIGIRGIQTAGADLVVKNGMQLIKQAAAPETASAAE